MPYSARSFHDRRHDQQIGPISPAQAVKLNSREEAEGHRGRQPVISTWKVWGKLDIKKTESIEQERKTLYYTPLHLIVYNPAHVIAICNTHLQENPPSSNLIRPIPKKTPHFVPHFPPLPKTQDCGAEYVRPCASSQEQKKKNAQAIVQCSGITFLLHLPS